MRCPCGTDLCCDRDLPNPATSDPLADRILKRLDALATGDLSPMTRLAYAHAAEIVRNEASR